MLGVKRSVIVVCVLLVVFFLAIQVNALAPEVKNAGSEVNSSSSDFGAVISPDGNFLFFTSDREGGYGGQDIWKSQRVNGAWTKPVNVGPPLNDDFNQGPDFYYKDADGKEYMLLTNCSSTERYMCDLYLSTRMAEAAWSKPTALPAPVNTVYSEANASLDFEHRILYFVSTRPGSIPGEGPKRVRGECSYDVWRVKWQSDGSWGRPEHLPPPVNTPGWEGAAFFHDASDTLYFSSTGHGGEGGADIFRTRETEPGVWSEPKPLKELNTNHDDMYFTIAASGEVAYFSETSPEGYGDSDIYMVPLSFALPGLAVVPRKGPGAGHVETIYFDFDRSFIRSQESPKLNNLVDFMNANLGVRIEVAGHADSVGADDYNVILSRSRAESVVKYLVAHKINPDRIVVTYYGESRPAEPNDSVKGNPLNRRVDISIGQ